MIAIIPVADAIWISERVWVCHSWFELCLSWPRHFVCPQSSLNSYPFICWLHARLCPHLWDPLLLLFMNAHLMQVPRSLVQGVGDAHGPSGLSAATAGPLCGSLAPVARNLRTQKIRACPSGSGCGGRRPALSAPTSWDV